MKLTLNRAEEQTKSIFKTTTHYYLHYNVELSSAERDLIEKHKWGRTVMLEVEGHKGRPISVFLDWIVKDPSHSWPFSSVETLAHAENQLITSAKALKQQLEAASGFTSGGPREIEL